MFLAGAGAADAADDFAAHDDGNAAAECKDIGDVALRGPASRLLFVLLRRVPPQDPQVEVLGDAALLTGWLAATPF